MPPVTCSQRPDERRLSRFPILLLDEEMLAPALGYVFDPKWIWPHESILSILWKFVLANRLPGHLVASQVNAKVDPYEGVLPSRASVDVRKFSDTLGVSTRLLRRSLLAGSEHRQCCASFRYCRLCSGLGYHSVLFQRPSESICPVHKVPLETTCRSCGRATSYLINACILEAPFRCCFCRTRFGSPFSISNPRPFRREGRIAIKRRGIARGLE
jgi:hypothetical protein